MYAVVWNRWTITAAWLQALTQIILKKVCCCRHYDVVTFSVANNHNSVYGILALPWKLNFTFIITVLLAFERHKLNMHFVKSCVIFKFSGSVAAAFAAVTQVSHTQLPLSPSSVIIGSRPSDHYFRSVCLSVCLCRVFLSRLWSDFDQTRPHVICLGLVVSPRI